MMQNIATHEPTLQFQCPRLERVEFHSLLLAMKGILRIPPVVDAAPLLQLDLEHAAPWLDSLSD